MSVGEWAVMLVFGVPIAALVWAGVFVVIRSMWEYL